MKKKCEICHYAKKSGLHEHHIIPRTDPRSTNFPNNLVTVCANCHNEIHACNIIVEGWAMTSEGSKFFWRFSNEKPKIRIGYLLQKDGTVDIRYESE